MRSTGSGTAHFRTWTRRSHSRTRASTAPRGRARAAREPWRTAATNPYARRGGVPRPGGRSTGSATRAGAATSRSHSSDARRSAVRIAPTQRLSNDLQPARSPTSSIRCTPRSSVETASVPTAPPANESNAVAVSSVSIGCARRLGDTRTGVESRGEITTRSSVCGAWFISTPPPSPFQCRATLLRGSTRSVGRAGRRSKRVEAPRPARRQPGDGRRDSRA